MRGRSERQRTDRSLRAERDKTDRELAVRRAVIQEDADEVLADARRAAGAVLRLARSRADELLDATGASTRARRQVIQERDRHDRKVTAERTDAEADLVGQREKRIRALTNLLAAERQDTDERLTTERRRADRDVAARDDFLAMASHDLRTLVTAVALTSGSLLRLESAAKEVTQAAKVIQRSAGQMAALIADFIDVVSIEAGRLKIIPERHTVGAVVDQVASTFQPLAREKAISLRTAVARDVPAAQFDRGRIAQVLSNLIANSVKFTDGGGHITIAAEPTPSGVQFSVTDDGCGIPDERQTAIFERFTQGRARDPRGFGLGLYIAKSIVEAHGGAIWVESKEGAGSTFRFTIPRAKARPKSGRSSASETPSRRRHPS